MNDEYSQYPKWLQEELKGRANLEKEFSKPKLKKKSLCHKFIIALAFIIKRKKTK